jgi:hypothetical protein
MGCSSSSSFVALIRALAWSRPVERLASLHVELPADMKLFRMTIQQDPYEMHETDPWWFVPLLYISLGLAIAGLAMVGLHLMVALGVP